MSVTDQPTMSTPAIRLRGLTKVYGSSPEPAVDALDLDVARGEVVALLGPSGCGKTTILRMINRLIEPTAGSIEIEGVDVTDQPVTDLRRSIGYVIQQIGLFPHRTIARNIAEVPRMLKWDSGRIDERVRELTVLVGLEVDMLDRYPDELSGGQQQRVGVARALAADPPVLLMDEPFGAVDPIVRKSLQDELLALQSRVQKTIVIVTHDLDEALRVADRIALFNVGGVIEQLATPDELMRSPASEFVEEFVGSDRGMRRLSLKNISSLDHRMGSVVDLDDEPSRGLEVMDREGIDWLGVVSEDRFAGWITRSAVEDAARNGKPLADLDRSDPIAQVRPDDTLRAAMELIILSNAATAVIDDNGRFGGVVTLEDLRAALGDTESVGAMT
jgi:osmoprotectant transport system ATP-binding protein